MGCGNSNDASMDASVSAEPTRARKERKVSPVNERQPAASPALDISVESNSHRQGSYTSQSALALGPSSSYEQSSGPAALAAAQPGHHPLRSPPPTPDLVGISPDLASGDLSIVWQDRSHPESVAEASMPMPLRGDSATRDLSALSETDDRPGATDAEDVLSVASEPGTPVPGLRRFDFASSDAPPADQEDDALNCALDPVSRPKDNIHFQEWAAGGTYAADALAQPVDDGDTRVRFSTN